MVAINAWEVRVRVCLNKGTFIYSLCAPFRTPPVTDAFQREKTHFLVAQREPRTASTVYVPHAGHERRQPFVEATQLSGRYSLGRSYELHPGRSQHLLLR